MKANVSNSAIRTNRLGAHIKTCPARFSTCEMIRFARDVRDRSTSFGLRTEGEPTKRSTHGAAHRRYLCGPSLIVQHGAPLFLLVGRDVREVVVDCFERLVN